MGIIDKMTERLRGELAADEVILARQQVMRTGFMKTASSATAAAAGGAAGALITRAATGGGPTPTADRDPAKRIDLGRYHVAELLLTGRRAIVAARKGEVIHRFDHHDATWTWSDTGRASNAVRRFVVDLPDGRWIVLEASSGWWRRKHVEAFTARLTEILEACR